MQSCPVYNSEMASRLSAVEQFVSGPYSNSSAAAAFAAQTQLPSQAPPPQDFRTLPPFKSQQDLLEADQFCQAFLPTLPPSHPAPDQSLFLVLLYHQMVTPLPTLQPTLLLVLLSISCYSSRGFPNSGFVFCWIVPIIPSNNSNKYRGFFYKRFLWFSIY